MFVWNPSEISTSVLESSFYKPAYFQTKKKASHTFHIVLPLASARTVVSIRTSVWKKNKRNRLPNPIPSALGPQCAFWALQAEAAKLPVPVRALGGKPAKTYHPWTCWMKFFLRTAHVIHNWIFNLQVLRLFIWFLNTNYRSYFITSFLK